jgi:hypothetical protein
MAWADEPIEPDYQWPDQQRPRPSIPNRCGSEAKSRYPISNSTWAPFASSFKGSSGTSDCSYNSEIDLTAWQDNGGVKDANSKYSYEAREKGNFLLQMIKPRQPRHTSDLEQSPVSARTFKEDRPWERNEAYSPSWSEHRQHNDKRLAQARTLAEKNHWEAALKFGQDRNFKVFMSSFNFDDESMAAWCLWFEDYAWHYHMDKVYTADELDFSKNDLTATGVDQLLSTFRSLGIYITNLKLHHNQIADATAIAALVAEGCLWEMHLSHNLLDTAAGVQIILAAAKAWDDYGYLYPRTLPKSGLVTPLWLRMEHNYMNYASLERMLYDKQHWRNGLRRGHLLCQTEKGSRGYQKFEECYDNADVPPVNTPYLWNQRSNPNEPW